MERIIYNKTLDVHKNGIQFTLQGFETADKLARQIVISLMASGDAVDFPLEQIMALMYVKTPSSEEQSIIECEIKDNTIIYDVLPIVEEGITEMQLKILETRPDGAKSVLATPKFAVEVLKSNADDESVQQKPEFKALVDAVASAKEVYDRQFDRMELSEDCMFRAYYVDGRIYETDVLKRLFNNGNVLLSQSYARGDSGVRQGEETDNSMYYSNVSKSASLESKAMKEATEDILEDVLKFSGHTAFKVNFASGEVEYVSPRYKFDVNQETGEMDVEGTAYTFEGDIQGVVDEWLVQRGADVDKFITATENIEALQKTDETHTAQISSLDKRDGDNKTRLNVIEANHKWVTFGEVTDSSAFSAEWTKDFEYKVTVREGLGDISQYSKCRYILKAGSAITITAAANLGSEPHGSLEILRPSISNDGGYSWMSLYKYIVNGEYPSVENPKTFDVGQDIVSEEFNIDKKFVNGVADYEYLRDILVRVGVGKPHVGEIIYNFTLEVQVRK